MTQRQKLVLAPNAPITISLLFDEPVCGSNEYGEFAMYAVACNGGEYSFFAPSEVHKRLISLKKGDSATITKHINTDNGKRVIHYDVATSEQAPKPIDVLVTAEKKQDRLAEIMLVCYQDAIEIQRQLGSMIDTSRIAITLFIARTKGVNSFSKQEIYQ